uniref:ATP synthase delta chain, chloroplastic n=1 Tax=Noccaea caerulescens TaxID=107243 RepID=A0A1J3FMU8_NOCCA
MASSLQQTLIPLRPKLSLSFLASAQSILPFSVRFPLRGGEVRLRMSSSVSGIYATALADAAKANDTLESTCCDVEKLEKMFSDPNVLKLFVNPTVELWKKREVIDLISESLSLLPYTANFLNVLIDSNRIDLVNEIMKEFEVVYNKMTQTELAVVKSVVKLDSQHLAQIAKHLQKLTGAKNVRIKTLIDPSLIAGFTIRFGSSGSKLIDMSVKKQLEDITTAQQLQLSG